ncbi:pheromone A receptor-domain-containing protein [Mycena leptocephala]|nr:pheromone A receptor-domain-containing protein [Mycena leptocephala]
MACRVHAVGAQQNSWDRDNGTEDACRRWDGLIASVRTVTKTRAERAILIDLTIGLGIPLLQIPLQYIIQGHRYNIFEDIGCLAETYETPLPSPSSTSPHPHRRRLRRLLCIKTFYHYRSQFRLLLSASGHANLSLNRYIRLMALASTNLLLTSFFLYSNVAVTGLSLWVPWRTRNILIPLSSSGRATLPVLIRKDTTQKRDSFDSFSDMVVSPLEYDTDEVGTLTLGDVSGMLPDYEESNCSSSPSSASSDSASLVSSIHGEKEEGKEEAEIAVSSLHCASPACTRPVSVQDAADIV